MIGRLDELERQVREAQETVKQLRRAAPSSIHDAVGQQLAFKSKDFDEFLTTGVVDKSVPVRVRVPSDLCASEPSVLCLSKIFLTLAAQLFVTSPKLRSASTRSVACSR